MARDFEDVHDIDDLSDDELRIVVRDHLDAHNGLDIDDLTVHVQDGVVTLGGRVGTEGERLIADHVVTDIVGAEAIRNEIFVDPIRRAESPEAIDEHLVDEDRRAGLQLGDRPTSQSPEVEERQPPIDADLYGTSDVRTAISDGTPWNPPEAPTQEGNAEGT
jgi:BON domain-containing protein